MLTKFKDLNLGKKLTVILTVTFLGGLIFSGSAVYFVLQNNAEHQISSEAKVLLKTMSSVRDYTHNQIAPELDRKSSEEEFLPQTIPAYAAAEVFKIFREDYSGENYVYKEAAINPRISSDLATEFETEIIKSFRKDSTQKDWSGSCLQNNIPYFCIAEPLAVTKSSCLECHSTPEKAPPGMLARYGKTKGFGWKLNEIVATKIIYVPANEVFQRARQSFIMVMSIVIMVFTFVVLLVNLWLKNYVVKPLTRMSRVAQALSTGHMEADFDTNSTDEVGRLAKSFKLMKTSLSMCVTRLEGSRGRRKP
ncbi:MAG: DUF3365 domain-containing protein [Prochloraceae cyanobacterium]|nr:DUF3365 domain-containing protein [Prochloraceae cyanobacterium]